MDFNLLNRFKFLGVQSHPNNLIGDDFIRRKYYLNPDKYVLRRISAFKLLDELVNLKRMEASKQLVCQPVDAFNPLITTSFQVFCILVISHIFNLLLKPLGGPFAQLLVSIQFISFLQNPKES